tara:strand:- start:181 stop:804 length:624 start_codon:yes stop_codon:yes gene_type:complete
MYEENDGEIRIVSRGDIYHDSVEVGVTHHVVCCRMETHTENRWVPASILLRDHQCTKLEAMAILRENPNCLKFLGGSAWGRDPAVLCVALEEANYDHNAWIWLYIKQFALGEVKTPEPPTRSVEGLTNNDILGPSFDTRQFRSLYEHLRERMLLPLNSENVKQCDAIKRRKHFVDEAKKAHKDGKIVPFLQKNGFFAQFPASIPPPY